jgi:hypothetical protein
MTMGADVGGAGQQRQYGESIEPDSPIASTRHKMK